MPMLERLFNGEFASINKEAKRLRIHESVLRRKLRYAAQYVCSHDSWEELPKQGPYILLADAIIKRIKGKWWTVYITAAKCSTDSVATLLPPIVIPGKESYAGWRQALNGVPDNLFKNTTILVCDGHKGLVFYAKWNKWLTQRCQAHLLFAISGRRSRSPWSRHREEGEKMYKLAKVILSTTDNQILKQAIDEIEVMGWQTKSKQLRKIINGFLESVDQYRTYLSYPNLNIPTTNNSIESFNSLFQEFCHRARGFASSDALNLWITAFAKNKKRITCNGYYQPIKRR